MFVNPYDKPERDDEKLEVLRAKGFAVTNDAHIYSLAGSAYRDLVENGVNQSIIITGESGAGSIPSTQCHFLLVGVNSFFLTAGKTSMARLVVKYLSAASSLKRGEENAHAGLEEKVVAVGVVMEGPNLSLFSLSPFSKP